MRAVSRGALASVCWHCSMQSGGMAVHEGKQCLFPCDVTIKSTFLFIQINSCNLPYTFCEQIGKEIKDISDEIPFEIPESWEWCRVKDLTLLFNGKAFKPSDWTNSGLPIVRIQNLNNDNAIFNYYNGKVEKCFLLNGEELLFAWSGTPGTSFGAHIWKGGKAVLNQHIFRLDYNKEVITKKYFMDRLSSQVQHNQRKNF